MFDEFRTLTDAQLRVQYDRCRDDLVKLKALNQVLTHRRSEAALDLQIEVVADIRRLTRGVTTPIETWLRQFLLTRSLGRPDGRALHRYRLTDEEYAAAAKVLASFDGRKRLQAQEDHAARLFVLFAAEWFRREAVSLFRRWDDVAPGVLGAIDDNAKRSLTLKGLQYWKRDLLIASDGSREFIITLSLEGGIPANVVLEDSSASLGGYLRLIMRGGLQDATPDHLAAIAWENREGLPPSYRHEDFIRQCAELCERLLYWRGKVEAARGGIDPVVYLDGLHPDWRRDLPIHVPAGQDSGLTRLLNGLMRDKLTAPNTVGVSARRLLVLQEGTWRQALHLSADGEISRHRFPPLSAAARVEIVPCGRLADLVPADFAVAYPPDGEQATWRIRPRLKLLHPLPGFEFSRPVAVNLVDGGASTAWTWPGGEALNSDLCVFEAGEGNGEAPDTLVLRAQGSYSSVAKRLYVWAPDGRRVEGAGVAFVAAFPLRRPGKLYRLDAVTYVMPDDDDTRLRIVAVAE